jgi:transcriptional regulator with XRE-family HTH domain
MTYLCDKVALIRKRFGLKQKELAELVETTALNIHRYENRKIRQPYNQRVSDKIDVLYRASVILQQKNACDECGDIEEKFKFYSKKLKKLLCKTCFNKLNPELYFK